MAGALTSNYNLLPVHGSIWDFTARIGLCKSIHAANMAKNEQPLQRIANQFPAISFNDRIALSKGKEQCDRMWPGLAMIIGLSTHAGGLRGLYAHLQCELTLHT